MTIGKKIPTKPTEYTPEELKIKAELLKFKDSYIFVNTNFKRKSQPIFVLAFCESQRNLRPNKESLLFKSDDEIFNIISNIVKQHYKKTNGTIGIWGDIVNYVYHHNGKTYVFNQDGNQIQDTTIMENRATLKLKGKSLDHILK